MIDLTTTYLGTRPEKSAGRIGVATMRFARQDSQPRGSRHRRRGAALRSSKSSLRWKVKRSMRICFAAPKVSRSRSTTFRTSLPTTSVPTGYLDLIRRAKASVSIPVIGSLNGVSAGGWIRYAREIEQAGADALELNLYSIETDPELSASQVERAYIELVREVKQSVKIPVAVKLSPFFSAPANFAKRLDCAGANALVLFNRFYQPDLDLEQLEVVPNLALSQPAGTCCSGSIGWRSSSAMSRPTSRSPAACIARTMC